MNRTSAIRHRIIIFFAFIFLGTICSYAKSSQFQQPEGYVSDTANILDSQSHKAIESELSKFDRSTGIQIAVLTIQTLSNNSIEEYANAVFTQWGIGEKKKDNGVLILIVSKDHKVRIEVGYGLESLLPDAFCGRIIRDVMAPAFRNTQYGDGVLQAIQIIEEKISGKEPSLNQVKSTESFGAHGISQFIPIIVAFLFILPFTTVFGIFSFILFLFAGIPFPFRFFSFLFIPFGFLLDISHFGRHQNHPFYGNYWGGGFNGGGFGGGGFGCFGGGSSGGGGASGGW